MSWRSIAKTAVYAELGGSAGLFSWNLERRLNDVVSLRVGAGRFSSLQFVDEPKRRYRTYTLMLDALTGGPNLWWEIGVGGTAGAYMDDPPTGLSTRVASITTTYGCRYQPAAGGLLVRLVLSPQFHIRGAPGALGTWVCPKSARVLLSDEPEPR